VGSEKSDEECICQADFENDCINIPFMRLLFDKRTGEFKFHREGRAHDNM
jgi:hypothetical protein